MTFMFIFSAAVEMVCRLAHGLSPPAPSDHLDLDSRTWTSWCRRDAAVSYLGVSYPINLDVSYPVLSGVSYLFK